MPARRIVENIAFGPEVIRVAVEAFDSAWDEIADRFPASMGGTVREKLAQAIIAAARAESNNPGPLREAGLQAIERAYPSYFSGAQRSFDVGKNGG